MSREQGLWDDEIRRLSASSSLGPAARAAVRAVLASLARDDTADRQTRRDAVTLLHTLSSDGRDRHAA